MYLLCWYFKILSGNIYMCITKNMWNFKMYMIIWTVVILLLTHKKEIYISDIHSSTAQPAEDVPYFFYYKTEFFSF